MIGAIVRFAETVLALDLDMVEPVCQRKALDLGALDSGSAVGHQCEFHAMCFQRIDRIMGARKDEHLFFPVGSIAVGQPACDFEGWGRMAGGSERRKSGPNDFMARIG